MRSLAETPSGGLLSRCGYFQRLNATAADPRARCLLEFDKKTPASEGGRYNGLLAGGVRFHGPDQGTGEEVGRGMAWVSADKWVIVGLSAGS
jgi:hypothetical protein